MKSLSMEEDVVPKIQVCFLMFQGHDVLDYAGPYEVFANILRNPSSPSPTQIFDITLIAVDEVITSSRNLCVNRHISIFEALTRILEYDILIIPGGPIRVLRGLCALNGPEVNFLSTFAALPTRFQGRERVILSICTGAILLGWTGLLSGRRATTHHRALDVLRCVCGGFMIEGSEECPTEVVAARYVDGGCLENGTRIVTAGGISSGIDASLYVLALVVGKEMADAAARIMEFERYFSLCPSQIVQ